MSNLLFQNANDNRKWETVDPIHPPSRTVEISEKANQIMNVLIVDDEPSVVAYTQKALLHDFPHFVVETATDGHEALARMGARFPRLVILDVQMPGLSGLDVLETMKNDADMRKIPVLAISGHPAGIERMMELGADGVLPKPFSPTQLMDRIHALLPRTEADPATRE